MSADDEALIDEVLEDEEQVRRGAQYLIAKFFERDMSWHDFAVCAQTDPEMFFPEKGGSTKEAKGVCADCIVRAECLEYALDIGERFGIWGGTSERERRRLAKEWGSAA